MTARPHVSRPEEGPTPERDIYDLAHLLRCLHQWTHEDLAPHVRELEDCADKLTAHVQRAKGRRAA